MERRRSKRKKVHIEAEIVSEDTIYPVLIENVSEHGIYIETDSSTPLSTSTRFTPGAKFEVRFQIPSGETLKLDCQVVWSFKTAPYGLTKKIGMEVIFPPPAYVKFCRAL